MFANLSVGEHTLRNEYNSEFFGGAYSNTYHISVVPEPNSLVLLGSFMLGWSVFIRRRKVAGPNEVAAVCTVVRSRWQHGMFANAIPPDSL
jgi:hypothetical protein